MVKTRSERTVTRATSDRKKTIEVRGESTPDGANSLKLPKKNRESTSKKISIGKLIVNADDDKHHSLVGNNTIFTPTEIVKPKTTPNSSNSLVSPRRKSISKSSDNISKPKTSVVEFEFSGPLGAFFIILGLPFVIYMLYYTCNKDICLRFSTFSSADSLIGYSKKLILLLPSSWNQMITFPAVYIYFGWMIFHILCERLLPGECVEGVELSNGKKLKYTMSGHLQFWLTILAMGHGIPIFTSSLSGAAESSSVSLTNSSWNVRGFLPLPLHLLYDHYAQLITVSVIGAFILSIYVYVASFRKGEMLAHGGNTGYHVYDFFIGRALNPRIGSLDLKEFCELRPGLIGWCVLNLGMACKQYLNRAKKFRGRGSISLSMFLITLSQGLYVWDALYQEKSILSTMDITTDGFGFMLAFGDLAWVPFIYSFQTRYLVDYDPQLSLSQCVVALVVQAVGFYIFRAANSQKDAFRKDPNSPSVAHLTYLQVSESVHRSLCFPNYTVAMYVSTNIILM